MVLVETPGSKKGYLLHQNVEQNLLNSYILLKIIKGVSDGLRFRNVY
jgi:hypothetical protein